MTREEWNACNDPTVLLECLRQSERASDRKLRLFIAACSRRAWHLFDADGRALVEVSERVAEGLASQEELMVAVWANRSRDQEVRAAVDHAALRAWKPAVALLATICARPPVTNSSPADLNRDLAAQERAQADLLRCVFGALPFRTPHVDPCWRTPTVLALAHAAYEEQVALDPVRPGWLQLDPVRLAVLADALEETGADEPEFLGHLRWPGEHVRGCWCIDLLLDRP